MSERAHFRDWIGRSETRRDVIAAAPLRGLAALLDYEAPPWGEAAPALAHWLYFLPTARQSDLDVDGHPQRGGFLPPVDLPRRMWAGGRLMFHAPLRVGAEAERVSIIKDVAIKQGGSGEMVFVTVAHEVRVDGVVAVSEEQDIVYRAASASAPPRGEPDRRIAVHVRPFAPDATALFRYSALTFNAHRIHYDRDYAVETEGYPGLVVQGPFIASALIDHCLRALPGDVRAFAFRAQRPLFEGETAVLCANSDGEAWCRNETGEVVMSARLEVG
jgi:3-methylfumaryl-CoA hydratase